MRDAWSEFPSAALWIFEFSNFCMMIDFFFFFSPSSLLNGKLNIQRFWGGSLFFPGFSYRCRSLLWQDRTFNRFIYKKQYPGGNEIVCVPKVSLYLICLAHMKSLNLFFPLNIFEGMEKQFHHCFLRVKMSEFQLVTSWLKLPSTVDLPLWVFTSKGLVVSNRNNKEDSGLPCTLLGFTSWIQA